MKKIEKLDDNKRSQLEKLLDKIEEGSLELESLIKFDFAPKPIAKPKIHIIEDYQPPFIQVPQENILIIKPISSWNNMNLIGLTEIRLYNRLNQIVQISINNITLKNAPVANLKNVTNLINGNYETIDEDQMWTCILPQFPLNLEIQISIAKNIDLGGIKIWNYNKNTLEIAKGVKDCEVYYNGNLKWKGIIKRGIGIENGLDYAEEIKIAENFEFYEESSESIKKNISDLKKESDIIQKKKKFSSNFDSEPILNIKNLEIQTIKDKIKQETDTHTSFLPDLKKKPVPDINTSQLSANKSVKTHPKTPVLFEEKPSVVKKIPISNIVEENLNQNIQKNSEMTTEKPKPKKINNRFENNKEFIENYCPKSKFFDFESEFTAKKPENPIGFNPLDTLKYFNLNNEARLIKSQIPPPNDNLSIIKPHENNNMNIKKSFFQEFDNELDGLDFFFQKSRASADKQILCPEKKSSDNDFLIPNLPSGRFFSLVIYTTWGDPYYVGLSGYKTL